MGTTIRLLLSFMKIGCIGFGGGSALIPVIRQEAVSAKGYLDEGAYTDLVITSNMTPGALPVKLAAGVGWHYGGWSGMLAAAFGVSLPSALLTVLLFALMALLPERFLFGVENASVGISVFILFLLVQYIVHVQHEQNNRQRGRLSLLITLTAFLLTGGGELRRLLQLPGGAILDISATDLLLLTFFLIFLGSCSKRLAVLGGLPLSLVYLLAVGKTPLLPVGIALWLRLLMLVCAAVCLVCSVRRGETAQKQRPRHMIQQVGIWLGVAALLSLPCLLFFPGGLSYTLRGLASTVCSFGGGAAYITVADGFFVAPGLIDMQQFYNRLIPLANALPGPLLCKVLAGVGYDMGASFNGWHLGALAALSGYSVSLLGSCGVFFAVNYLYRRYEQLPVLVALKNWILPLVSGLLLSTMAAMITESLAISAARGWAWPLSIGLQAALFAGICFLREKKHVSDLPVIILAAVISCAAFGFFG